MRNADMMAVEREGYQSAWTLAMGCLFSRGKRMNRTNNNAIAAVAILWANVTFIAAAYASITADEISKSHHHNRNGGQADLALGRMGSA
jgi:hypothetical protein